MQIKDMLQPSCVTMTNVMHNGCDKEINILDHAAMSMVG